MIDQPDVDNAASRDEPVGEFDILIRWRGIARGMVVNRDDLVSAEQERAAKHQDGIDVDIVARTGRDDLVTNDLAMELHSTMMKCS